MRKPSPSVSDLEEETYGGTRWPTLSMRAKYAIAAGVYLAFLLWTVPRTTTPLISQWSPASPTGITAGDLAALLVGVSAVALAIDTLIRPSRRMLAIILLVVVLTASAILISSTQKPSPEPSPQPPHRPFPRPVL